MIQYSLVFLFLIVGSIESYGQYLQYLTTCNCAKNVDNPDYWDKSMELISSSLQSLKENGDLYNYELAAMPMESKDSVELGIVILAKDRDEFVKATNHWESEYPEILKNIAELCVNRMDILMDPRPSFYPEITLFGSNVYTIEEVEYIPDTTIEYKIIFDMTAYATQRVKGEKTNNFDPFPPNLGLVEIGRVYNLHVGSGIPSDKLNMIVAVHGNAINAFLTEEAYFRKYAHHNLNIEYIQELSEAGVQFFLCGQSNSRHQRIDFVPEVKFAFSAQPILNEYQMKGYALKLLKND